MAIARRDLYPLIDRALGGSLERKLRKSRAEQGLSYDEIAHHLRVEHDVVVSGETVRRWCMDLAIAKAQATA